MRRSVWRERDPIGRVARETGMTRLQVLEGIRARLLSRWREELARNPKAPQAMRNMDVMIEAERERTR